MMERVFGPLKCFKVGLLLVRRIRLCVAALFVIGAMASACASTASPYYGIDLSAVYADASTETAQIQALARRAKAGEKQAQLALGIRFEEGEGVPRDLEAARALYSQAAEDTQLKHTAFISDGGATRAETVYTGVEKGLEEAADRLRQLEQSLTGQQSRPAAGVNDAEES